MDKDGNQQFNSADERDAILSSKVNDERNGERGLGAVQCSAPLHLKDVRSPRGSHLGKMPTVSRTLGTCTPSLSSSSPSRFSQNLLQIGKLDHLRPLLNGIAHLSQRLTRCFTQS
jgi:hypothetical protein